MGADPRDCSPLPALCWRSPAGAQRGETFLHRGSGAGSRESANPYLAQSAGPVGLPSPASRHRNSREACAVSQRDPQGRVWWGGTGPWWVTAGRGWHNPTHDAAHGAPRSPRSSAGWAPSGYFAGTAKRSPGKQIRSRARLKCLKLPVPRAGCASEPSPARPRVPAAPNYTAGPGGPGPAQLGGAGPSPAAGKNGIVMGWWELAPGTGTGIPAARVGTLGREG